MFLSRLYLNPASRAVQHDLADCQQLHRTVMKAFPGALSESARQELGVLYRVERTRAQISGLVQSKVEPDWSSLPVGYLVPGCAAECKPVTHEYAGLTIGERLRFRLRANPTRKIQVDDDKHPTGQRPTRVELRGEANWISWLERKGGQHGFQLLSVKTEAGTPDLRTSPGGRVFGFRATPVTGGPQARSRLTLFSVVYEGRLAVTNAELFRDALAAGVGPGKAYGFGLLSIARDREA
jgi:CRISPR system Cascade subunit CasE